MVIFPSGGPVYRQVARMLEHRIHTQLDGYGPGWTLPSVAAVARELGVGVGVVEAAYQLLAHMGLITQRQGYGAVVREGQTRRPIQAPPGAVVTARMPTMAEQDQWRLEPGVPMLVVDGRAYPADRFKIETSPETTDQ